MKEFFRRRKRPGSLRGEAVYYKSIVEGGKNKINGSLERSVTLCGRFTFGLQETITIGGTFCSHFLHPNLTERGSCWLRSVYYNTRRVQVNDGGHIPICTVKKRKGGGQGLLSIKT